jgi:aspartate racemase
VWKRVIGIVGGLGPHAHIELERLILQATSDRLDRPAQDQDYPEWVLSSVPSTPDRTGAIIGEGPSPVAALERSLARISGADFAVIPCNTAHYYLDDLRQTSPIPILDMIGETIDTAVGRMGTGTKLGILATTGTLHAGIYSSTAKRLGRHLEIISLLDLTDSGCCGNELQERLVMEPIYGPLAGGRRMGGGIKSGVSSFAKSGDSADRLAEAVQILARAGAEMVVLGCTEIPLALGRHTVGDTPVLDPLEVAANAAVEIALDERPLP